MSNRSPLSWLGRAILALYLGVAICAPLLAPFDPGQAVAIPLAAPDSTHWLGTNDLGQDNLSQLLLGTRSSLFVAVSITIISTVMSWTIGIVAGFVRRLEGLLMWTTDFLLALPDVPLLLLILTLVGATRTNLIVVLGLLSWPGFARIVRSIVISARVSPYVEASRAMGASDAHIMLRHLIPATRAAFPTKLVLTLRFAVFAEATLAFLGLAGGNAIGWGAMLNLAFRDSLLFSRDIWPWLVLPPTFAIALLILATVWVLGSPGNRKFAT